MLAENLKKVREIWELERLKIAEPLTEAQVVESLARLNRWISQDVIEVYSTLGGMLDYAMDELLLSFWTIERICEENKQWDSELIFFADFLIDSHFYGFKFENEKISSVYLYYGDDDFKKIADSFDEFLKLYIEEPDKLGVFKRESYIIR